MIIKYKNHGNEQATFFYEALIGIRLIQYENYYSSCDAPRSYVLLILWKEVPHYRSAIGIPLLTPTKGILLRFPVIGGGGVGRQCKRLVLRLNKLSTVINRM